MPLWSVRRAVVWNSLHSPTQVSTAAVTPLRDTLLTALQLIAACQLILHQEARCKHYLRQRSCRENKRSWLYRIRPSVTHEPFHPLNFPVEQLTSQGGCSQSSPLH